MPVLDTIDVMGYNYQARSGSLQVNGASVGATSSYDSSNKVLSWKKNDGIFNFSTGEAFTITWSHSK